jgi:hypothetical protein
MDREAIRAFARRDRASVESLKRAHHARRHREDQAAGYEAGRVLFEHARRVRPDWPTARDRAEDLAHHLEQKRLLDRTAHVVAGR